MLEWIAISFSRGSSRPRNRTWVSCIAGILSNPCTPHLCVLFWLLILNPSSSNSEFSTPSERAVAPYFSSFAWRIPWAEKPCRLQSMGSLRVSDMTEWLCFHFSLSCIGEGNGNALQFLAWRIPATGEPGGLPSMGSRRVRHDWSDAAAPLNWE